MATFFRIAALMAIVGALVVWIVDPAPWRITGLALFAMIFITQADIVILDRKIKALEDKNNV